MQIGERMGYVDGMNKPSVPFTKVHTVQLPHQKGYKDWDSIILRMLYFPLLGWQIQLSSWQIET